jgi:hypothetical protein
MRRSTAVIVLFTLAWIAGSIWIGVRLFDAVNGDGSIEVRIRGDGGRIELDVPAFFAVRALRHATWTHDHGRVLGRREFREWAPALRAALTELEGYDDVPLLEIEDGRSLVTMSKRRGRFVLEIEDGRERVRLVMPAAVIRQALAEAGV